MLSTVDKKVPLFAAPGSRAAGKMLRVMTPYPGLNAESIQGLEGLFPGMLTAEMRSLLGTQCGFHSAELGTIDFTSRWHPEEPLSVFRPCLTLGIDDAGRRWIAETSRHQGLPGPVWCVLSEPGVAVYVSDDLSGFFAMLKEGARLGCISKWLRSLAQEARIVWANRYGLARQSRDQCRNDRDLRAWLAGLPFDASVYDLRAPAPTRGWPYDLAGPEGRLYRCGKLPVFAVAGCETAGRWRQHLPQIAAIEQLARPAAAPP